VWSSRWTTGLAEAGVIPVSLDWLRVPKLIGPSDEFRASDRSNT
jgi:hypothetical protein